MINKRWLGNTKCVGASHPCLAFPFLHGAMGRAVGDISYHATPSSPRWVNKSASTGACLFGDKLLRLGERADGGVDKQTNRQTNNIQGWLNYFIIFNPVASAYFPTYFDLHFYRLEFNLLLNVTTWLRWKLSFWLNNFQCTK